MSIDFATMQGLAILDGTVTEIKDASGRVLWSAVIDYPEGALVYKVKKVKSNTYAGETEYSNEQFILLDIYPMPNGIVTVTYGGLTKTITDTTESGEPNAQQVFFGTFNGMSDSVTTPTSGILIVEGDYVSVGISTYVTDSKGTTKYCGCVTNIVDFGNTTKIHDGAFAECKSLTRVVIPSSVSQIGGSGMFDTIGAFYRCTNLSEVIMTDTQHIGYFAFSGCESLTHIIIPHTVERIYNNAFKDCINLINVTFVDDSSEWAIWPDDISPDISDAIYVVVNDPANNATLLTQTYTDKYWRKTNSSQS